MNKRLCHVLSLVLLLLLMGGNVQALALPQPRQVVEAAAMVELPQSLAEASLPEGRAGLPGARADWWSAVQADIRQSEYQVTWQEYTYLPDLSAAYQAPNRAQDLRTYFSPAGIRVIPRVFAGETPPWEWGLALSGYAAADELVVQGNRVEYVRAGMREWYINAEAGLEQEVRVRNSNFEFRITTDLIPRLLPDANTNTNSNMVEFLDAAGAVVLRYGPFIATDAAGRPIPLQLRLASPHTLQLVACPCQPVTCNLQLATCNPEYPLTVQATLASPISTPTGLSPDPDWTAEGDQAESYFGYAVGPAGDVNGDGYSDVIVGAQAYDNGQTDEGRAFVYYGMAEGLATTPAWTAEGDQADAALGYAVGTAGDVNGDGYGDVIVSAVYYDNGATNEGRAYVYHGSTSGLSATPDWVAEGNQTSAWFGCSLATAGDIDGDGYSDVVVGAHGYDNGATNEGRAYVYHGAAGGLSLTPNWMAEGNQESAAYGWSVGPAGDVNGDGYSDVIVGAYWYDNGATDEGRAYVYHGAPGGLSATADWTAEGNHYVAEFGYAVGTAGDVNGDGYSDVIVGARLHDNGQTNEGRAYVYHGAAGGLASTPAWIAEGNQDYAQLGRAVGTAGDVNGDGYGDVIVGAYGYDNGETNEGRAYVYHGAAGGLSPAPDWTAESDQADAQLGRAVRTAGDVNGDGYSDVIVGARYYDNGETDEGAAFVYHGGAAGLASTALWTAEGDQADAALGYAVGAAGDVNGDGYGDVIVGVPLYDNGETDEGSAFVYYGSAVGPNPLPDWIVESDQDGAGFGLAVGTAGDVNCDGYADVIIGAYHYGNDQPDEGRVFVYHGSAAGLSLSPNWLAEGDQEGDLFGASVAAAGDVNGDGCTDVIVGAPYYSNTQAFEGRAFVYHGSADGLSITPAWTAEGDQAAAFFGDAVSTAGDVNGDGYSDIVVGADFYDNDQVDEGRAFVYHGSKTGLSPIANWTTEGDRIGVNLGNAVATSGDVNGDGYADVIVGAYRYDNVELYEGRAYVFHGSPAGLSPVPSWTAEGNQYQAWFGYAAAAAGDVNGDGYADVIVGARSFDNGQTDEGRAYVFHGSAGTLSASPDWTIESDQAESYLGAAVAAAGDVNGDGYSDVIVGAPGYDNTEIDEGRAYLYYGNAGDGLHLLPRQLRSDGSALITYLGMSDARTAFQLSLIGRMPLGREEVRLQWQVAPLGMPITTTGVISGVSSWTDVLTTGVEISQTVTGLTLGMPYHWRVRLLYRPGNALGQPAGRWIHIPWSGWNETDLRTEPNLPPVADAGLDQITPTLSLVTLDGSASFDPDGDDPLSYRWTQAGGPLVTFTANLSVTTFTAPADPAVLTFTLSVTDSLGLPDPTPDAVMVTVTNQPPVAAAGPDQITPTLALVTLDGRASFDPDGDDPLTYDWTQTGGPPVTFTADLSVTTFTAPADPAVLTFTLVVTDNWGLPDPTPDAVVITVTNQPPVADAGPDQITPTRALVTLDGSGSSDLDGDYPLVYYWSQTGGPPVTFTSNLSVTTFTAPADPVVLTFTLVVTDVLGLPDSTPDEVVIIVQRGQQYHIYLPLIIR